MAVFEYSAVDRSGQRISGQIQAPSRREALHLLSSAGHLPIEAREKRESSQSQSLLSWLRRPTATDLTLLTRELSLLLSAGQSLSAALSTIHGDTGAPRIQALAGRLVETIAGGKSFSEALAAEGTLFPAIYTGMVKAAEMSGQLTEVLGRVADARESEQKLRSKIISALTYPCMLMGVAVATVIFLLGFVVPRFKDSLGDQAGRLPASAAAVMQSSDWLVANGHWLAIGLAATLPLFALVMQRPGAKAGWARFVLRLPVIGSLVRTALTIRFCRSLSILLSSGLGLPAALALTREVIGNAEAGQLIDKLASALRDGVEFTDPLARSQVFPPLVASLLRVGAHSGSLAEVSGRLAVMYETKLDVGLQRLMSILEPVIILLVSAFVALIVLSIMSAIIGIYDLTGS